MKPVFCGNFEYDAREGDLERLFRKYGRVERVDMKAGRRDSDDGAESPMQKSRSRSPPAEE
ncbi:hypothetical protein F2Q69_00034017 [Brassica cretica]|uniref:RRM domain-containing protein n=1 Tax=Brassica cretica TaxID=69181 RepID=A0A8S9SDR1_BRACR|nr:hypothetical protein F2Q69_00034017 [Brassica cretica]